MGLVVKAITIIVAQILNGYPVGIFLISGVDRIGYAVDDDEARAKGEGGCFGEKGPLTRRLEMPPSDHPLKSADLLKC